MNPAIKELQEQNRRKAELAEQSKERAAMHREQIATVQRLESRMVQAFESLLRYLNGKDNKQQTIDKLTSIGTPDALKVMTAVNNMHSTLKRHKNTDLSEVTKLLRTIVKEVKSLPKDATEPIEAVSIDNLPDFDTYYRKIEKAITSLNMKPQVFVDAPKIDLSSLENKQQEVIDTLGKGLEVSHTNILIHEKFDEWRLVEDDYNEDEPLTTGIRYYLSGKKVAEIKYILNGKRIVGVKKV